MAIEIKELHIKVKVTEAPKETVIHNHHETTVNTEAMKADIIKKCTRNVLEILKERQER